MNISAIMRPRACHHALAPFTAARRSWLPGESIFLSAFSAASDSGDIKGAGGKGRVPPLSWPLFPHNKRRSWPVRQTA